MNELPPDSLEVIYRQYRHGLFSLALSVVGCEQMAEDAVHEAMVSICRKPRSERDLVAYVFTAVRNASIDQARKKSRTAKMANSLFNGVYLTSMRHAPSTAHLAISREREDMVRDAIDALEPDQKGLVIMKQFAGLTFEQIGDVMDIPMKTAATRYRRVLDRLKQQLKGKI